MQFSDIDSYVTDRYPSGMATSDRKAHINEVYLDLTRAFTPDITEINDDTLSTVEDEDTLTLTWKARQIKKVSLLNDTARVRLRRVSEQALIRDGESGLPRYWSPYGNTQNAGANYLRFLLNPVPDGTYPVIVEYEPSPVALTADTDVPAYIPEEYHQLIAWGTIAILASHQEDWSVANAWEARFRGAVNEMLLTLGITAPENYPNLATLTQEGGGSNV